MFDNILQFLEVWSDFFVILFIGFVVSYVIEGTANQKWAVFMLFYVLALIYHKVQPHVN